MYLWERGYGTSVYKAGTFARIGDRFVARHIGFEQARRNYATLLDIPVRLREHVDRLEKQAEAEMQKLAALEQTAEEAEGGLVREKELATAKTKLQEFDHAIAEEEKRYALLLQQREPYTVGKDRQFQEALELLATSLRAEPLPQLRREAQLTASAEDDRIVNDLIRQQHEENTLESSLQEHQTIRHGNLQRLHELEQIRQQFKQQEYDSPYSDFGNGDAVSILISQFLRGMINAEQMWRTMQRNQRFRRPSYPRPSDIGFPDTFRFPSGIRLPDGWGSGGIGFPGGSSGGERPSGGGGGFRTGGGF
ncbi:MAG: hypothetical protein FJ147_14805 [Deltaproteobacteria bacterium]|nr:hypothetical protein [Deltaproteobacteria bacterium]